MDYIPFDRSYSFLTADDCRAWIARCVLPDLAAIAQARYRRKVANITPGPVAMTSTRAFCFDQAAGEAALILAFAGCADPTKDGLDGLSVHFEPDEMTAAAADLVWLSNVCGDDLLRQDLQEKLRRSTLGSDAPPTS